MKIVFWKHRLARLLAACGLLMPASLLAAPLNTNLVLNPSFEDVDESDLGPYTAVRVFDWEDYFDDFVEDDNYSYPYFSNYGGFPAPVDSGDYHYTGGFNTLADEVQVFQSIDVSNGPSGGLIATGDAFYSLSGFFSTYLQQADASRVRAVFLDGSNQELESTHIGGADFVNSLPVTDGKTDWGQNSVAGLIPVGTATVEIQIIADVDGENHDGYLDLVDFQVTDQVVRPTLDIEVDRDARRLTLFNRTGADVNFSGYSVVSPFGALDGANWLSIAGNYDADSGGDVDSQNVWTELTPREIGDELNEGDLDTGTGTTLAPGKTIELGAAVWLATPTEDLTFQYTSDDQAVQGIVEFVGNDDSPFQLGDLNTDRKIDVDDWKLFRAGQHVAVSSGSGAEAYQLGDLNGDLVNDHSDFVIFQYMYDQAQGPGALEMMVNSIPEGSASILLLIGWSVLVIRSRRRRF